MCWTKSHDYVQLSMMHDLVFQMLENQTVSASSAVGARTSQAADLADEEYACATGTT